MDRVLIVDDEKEILEVLKEGLQKYEGQFEVVTATNGKQAVEVLKNECISVLVTDLMMPEMNGLQLLAYMNENYPQVPCIVMTSYGSDEIRERVQENETLRYINKPFHFNEIAWIIVEALDRCDEDEVQAGLSVSSLLQLVEMEEKTFLMEIGDNHSNKGIFYFDSGVVLDALCGELKGEDAAFEMIGWNHVTFRFKSLPKEGVKQRIHMSLISLLMEGAHRKDEATAPEGLDSAQAASAEQTGRPKQSPALEKRQEENELIMISRAIHLAERMQFQQSRKILAELLKSFPRSAKGWLWYSRVTGSMKAIGTALENAAIISPKDPQILGEIRKFKSAEKKVWTERVRHCPFCWSPVEKSAVACHYCKAHLLIHEQFFTSQRTAKQEILEEAIQRYEKVLRREENADAFYFMAMAVLNLERWEDSLDYLNRADKLAPDNTVFAEQLNALMNYMTAMETLSDEQVCTREREAEAVWVSQGTVRKNRVLVVDDSAVTRKVITMTLGKKGYTVATAKNGLEALVRLNEGGVGLMLLDIVMPGMDGYKVLSIMKMSPEFKKIPVIMLTARDTLLDKLKGKMSGPAEYLTKPFDPEVLVAKVRKYLQ